MKKMLLIGFVISAFHYAVCAATADKLIYVATVSGSSEIMRIDADGTNLINLTNNAGEDFAPAYSPVLDKIVFVSNRTGTNQIFVMNADGTNPVNLSNSPTSADNYPAWSPTGAKIVFIRNGTPDASADGVWTMNADGISQTRIRSVSAESEGFDFRFAYSPDGATIAFRRPSIFGTYLIKMNSNGQNSEVLDFEMHLNSNVSFSPDGAKILFTKRDANNFAQIYTVNPDGTNGVFLTSGNRNSEQPSWSSDGGRIIFSQNISGSRRIVGIDSDGANQLTVAPETAEPVEKYLPVFSPDNSRIAFAGTTSDFTQTGLTTLNADGSNQNFLTVADAFSPFLWVNRATVLRYSRLGVKISEAGVTAQIKVLREGDVSQTTTVNYATADGTATAGQDYVATSGTLTFAPFETLKTFNVSIINDSVFEADETVLLNLSNVSGGTFDAGSNAALTILNDESAFEFHAASLNQSSPEANTSTSFRIARLGSVDQAATVTFSTVNGSADAGLDYNSAAMSVFFGAGVREQTVSVQLLPDNLGEGGEYFSVRLTNASVGNALGANASTQHRIIDDDSCASPLDATFNGCGKLTMPIGIFDVAQDLAIQPDGKIIVAGTAAVSESASHFGLMRLNTDGSLDSTFDADGKIITQIGIDSGIYGLALQTDGKILALGRAVPVAGESDLVLARYNSNGSLDPTFGTNGIAVVSFNSGNGSSDIGNALAVQPDGKIVVAGFTIPFSGGDSAAIFARFETNGALDPGFGVSGKLFVGLSGVQDMILQPDGAIVAAGARFFSMSVGNEPLLMRVLPNGALDPAFDGDGIATVPTDGTFYGIALQPNGAIVAVGTGTGTPSRDSLIARFNANGSLDQTFDGDGVKTIQLPGSGYDELYSVAIQSNGKILAVGGTGDFYVVRLNANGSPDDSLWGINGILQTDFGGGETPYAAKIQPNGKITVAGIYQNTASDARFAVARYISEFTPTAANVFVSGRVANSKGSGIGKVTVSLTDASGATRTVSTGSFGSYKFDGVPAGQTYILSVNHKRYVFEPDTRILNVVEDVHDVDFTAPE